MAIMAYYLIGGLIGLAILGFVIITPGRKFKIAGVVVTLAYFIVFSVWFFTAPKNVFVKVFGIQGKDVVYPVQGNFYLDGYVYTSSVCVTEEVKENKIWGNRYETHSLIYTESGKVLFPDESLGKFNFTQIRPKSTYLMVITEGKYYRTVDECPRIVHLP